MNETHNLQSAVLGIKYKNGVKNGNKYGLVTITLKNGFDYTSVVFGAEQLLIEQALGLKPDVPQDAPKAN